VWLLTVSTNGLLRLFRIDPHAEENQVTEEEIRVLVDLGEEKGAIAPEEGRMIDNVLELADKTAAMMMTPRTDLVVLWQEDTIDTWRQTICETSYSRYPVCDEDMDDIKGVLHVRDLLCADGDSAVRPAFFVPETVAADGLMREMQRRHEHMAVVIDEYGGTSGVVTLEDILEEIVGEIEDEHDHETPVITAIAPGQWRVRGSADLVTLGKAVGVSFPEGDYDTLGGFIFAQMDSIPDDGTHPEVDMDDIHIHVDELADRRVEWATLLRQEPKPKV
jgi:putative hemolysin